MDLRVVNPAKSVKTMSGFIPVEAIGGKESFITASGVDYKVHTFSEVGSSYLQVLNSGTVECLVVAGGGGGGMDMGGGGGGGGVLSSSTYKVNAGEIIPIVVGAGGSGGPGGGGETRTDGHGTQPNDHQFTIPATGGGDSQFGSLVAIGGGFGGSSYRGYTPGIAGGVGGSGGGASGYNDNAGTFLGGAGTTGQGFRGGNSTAAYYSGGGGGAAGQGVDSTAQPNGGPGILNNILGVDLYWGGGGGGASYSLSNGGNGGIGGGGGGALGTATGGAGLNPGSPGGGGSPNSHANTRGGNGGANTGGGGGGGAHYNRTNSGGDGGSGIVIVRYPLQMLGLPGGSSDNPAISGVQLKSFGLPTGNYWIKPSGYSGAAEFLWVDNDNQGGGWVLIGKGRHATPDNSGWFGTDAALSTSGLTSANAATAGISKVSASFINYLMNGTASGWQSGNANNYLIGNRIGNAADGLGGVGDSFYLKVTNSNTFTWINQFGRAAVGDSNTASTGTGTITRYSGSWLGGTNSGSSSTFIDNDFGSNNGSGRIFTWHWGSHGVFHGWSSGSTELRGFQNTNEGHAIQFVQLWAR
jgi:hypothetical protein